MHLSSSVGTGTFGTSVDDLYRLHAGAARQVAQSITRNDDDAADAVAEAVAGVLEAISAGRLADRESFRPYLLTATRNASIDILRRTGRLTLTDEVGAFDGAAAGAGPCDRLEAREDRALVTAAFADLPARWRAVLWLTEVERLPPREVALLLDLTPNAVAQLAVRARSRLRQRYAQMHVRNHASGDCLEATEHLGGLVAGELTAVQANRVRGHLAECEDCRGRLAELDGLGLPGRRAAVPLPLLLLDRLRARWRRWGSRRAALGPTVDTAAPASLVDLASSPAVQHVAAAVTAGLLALGIGAAVVRDAGPPPAPLAAPPALAAGEPASPTTTTPPAPSTSTTAVTTTTVPAPVVLAAPAGPAAFVPAGPLASATASFVAHATVAALAVHDSPGGPARFALANPRRSGAPLVLLVTDNQPGWLQVLLPVRPNGSAGWIRADQARLVTHSYRIVVELEAHRLTAYQGTEVVLSEPVAVGTSATPTPRGLYYTTELFEPLNLAGNLDPTGPYGPYAYGLSGFSEVLFEFGDGDGQFGIHGTNDPGALGTDVSNGCIRMSNAGITALARILPPGVPVEIRP